MLDLIVVGCGPVGAVAGNLAGRAGLNTLVLDRADEVFTKPRAIHFDAHIMRILQQAGVVHEMLPDLRVWKASTFYGVDGKPIRVHRWSDETPYGWDPHYLFYQPHLEAILRHGLSRFDNVELRLGLEAVGLRQDDDHVTLTVQDSVTEETSELTARHLVGADGASSFVRRSNDIELVDGDFDEPWLVVDVLCDRPLGQPNESEMFCDPARPSTRVPGPGRHHRWEFMLLPEETPEQMQRPESIATLLAPWVSMDEVTVIRASVYRFHSLVAETWRAGRLFLAGDAAHQTPPFLGQGLCHGIRDVQNLIAKLVAVSAGASAQEMLDSYEAERRPHVEQIIDMAVSSGREICLLDPVAALDRDRRMRRAATMGELPRTTFQGMPPLRGGLFSSTPAAGELFLQPMVYPPDGDPRLFDEVFPPQVVLVAHHTELPQLTEALAGSRVPVVAYAASRDDAPGHADYDGLIVDPLLGEWFEQHGSTVAVIRPDRYVHGTASSTNDGKTLLAEALRCFPTTS